MTETPLRVEGTRAYAQGEIFLLTKAGDRLDALVYNTTGFGPCPAAEFAALDVAQIAKDTGSDLAWKNHQRSGSRRSFSPTRFHLGMALCLWQ